MENGSKPVTQADLQAVKTELTAEIQSVRTDFKSELKAEIQTAKTELRAELRGVETRLAKGIIDTQSELRQLKDSIPTKADWERLYRRLDETMGEGKDNRRTLIIYDDILGKHRKTLESHEKRLTDLEAKP